MPSAGPRPGKAATIATILVGAVLSTGCADLAPRGTGIGTAAAAEPEAVHVDSILPIEMEIARFRAALDERSTELSGGASSAEALVSRFMTALEARDLTSLAGLVLTPAEFIDLYYPHTRFTKPPYRMGPELVWLQMENYGSRGLSRALERAGGRDLNHAGHECDTVVEEGPNRIHSGCVVRVETETGPSRLSLFGPIIERDGRFKFLSYANTL